MGRNSKEVHKKLELQAFCPDPHYKNNYTFFNKTMKEAIAQIRKDAQSRGVDMKHLVIQSKR